MAWIHVASFGIPAGVVLLGGAIDSLTSAASTFDYIKSAAELGLAITIAVVSFGGLIWWFRRVQREHREDILRMSAQMEAMREFQQGKLLHVATCGNESLSKAADAIEAMSDSQREMTAALIAMQGRLEFRPCFALDVMDDESRAKITAQIRRAIRASHTQETPHE